LARSDDTLSLIAPQRMESMMPRVMTPFIDDNGSAVEMQHHVSDSSVIGDVPPTRYHSFIAVLLCLLRLVFTFGVTTYSYALHSLRRQLLWAQLTVIGVGVFVGVVTTWRFFSSLKETYAVLHKERRSSVPVHSGVVHPASASSASSQSCSAASQSAGSTSRADASLAVAASYESWSRGTLCTTSPIRMLSVFKPAVLEVLVSRACGATAFSMPVTDVFGGWRCVDVCSLRVVVVVVVQA
jgi:hypothetical protein